MLDIEDLIKDLKARPECNGKVGVLGFCFGGRYAHLAAARLGVDAAGAYHGTKIGEHLDETPQVTCPVSLHFGAVDPAVPMDEVEAIGGLCAPQPRRDCRLSRGGPQFCYALQGRVPRSSRQGVPCRCPTLLPAHVKKALTLLVNAAAANLNATRVSFIGNVPLLARAFKRHMQDYFPCVFELTNRVGACLV